MEQFIKALKANAALSALIKALKANAALSALIKDGNGSEGVKLIIERRDELAGEYKAAAAASRNRRSLLYTRLVEINLEAASIMTALGAERVGAHFGGAGSGSDVCAHIGRQIHEFAISEIGSHRNALQRVDVVAPNLVAPGDVSTSNVDANQAESDAREIAGADPAAIWERLAGKTLEASRLDYAATQLAAKDAEIEALKAAAAVPVPIE